MALKKSEKKLNSILTRIKKIEADKQPWLVLYQLISEYIGLRKQNFTGQTIPGAFVVDGVFDSTAIEAAEKASSSLLGALFPSGSRTFRFVPTKELADETEVRQYFSDVTNITTDILDDSEAGLLTALGEYMYDEVVYGTAGIGVFEDVDNEDVPLYFEAWDIKNMGIGESSRRRADIIYRERSLTIREAVTEYGLENLSSKVQELFNKGKGDSEVKVTHLLEPRLDADPYKFGSVDKPVASIHFEKESNHIIRESGFDDMPVLVGRFSLALGETYGRSPAMRCLPDVLELNAIWESATLAIEKAMNPPMAMYSDSIFGAGIVDASPGGCTVVNGRVGASASANPIWQLQTVGDLSAVEALINKLELSIQQAFMLDRLLDFNNETRMTAYETSVREKFRGESLSNIYKRQEFEVFTPMLNRVFNILLKRGKFGVIRGSKEDQELINRGVTPMYIPDSLVKNMIEGKQVFKIQYISPAKRIMFAEEAQSIMSTFEFASAAASVAPEAIDNIDVDKAVKRLAEVTGIPLDIIRATDAVASLREARAQQQELIARAQQMRDASESARNFAQAEATSNKVDMNLNQ